MLRPEPACLAIADITGYTRFLAGAELDHAQDILADLMNTVVRSLRPTLRLAKLEGDAVFVYVITDAVDGPVLQDTIEGSYFAFRRRLRDIRQASSCECNACVLVPALDLKVVLHHGQVVRQRIGTSEELVGSDVIVVHRLLKNGVTEATGIGAYALYTDACVAAMALGDPSAAGMVRHEEAFDDVGEIGGWIADLGAAWAGEIERSRVVVDAQNALAVYEATLDAPQALVWEYITSPALRPRWQLGVEAVIRESGPAGRRGVGTVNHCMHGKDVIIEEVVDWEPPDHVTYRSLLPVAGAPKLLNTFQLSDLGAGRTRLEFRLARPRARKDRAMAEDLAAQLDRSIKADMVALETELAAAGRGNVGPEVVEPELPQSLGRMVTEPIRDAGPTSGC
jgi:uncharacterized protein YndB with AHSA1/START domain